MNNSESGIEQPKPPRPGFRDWAIFGISAAFVVMACFIAWKNPRDALFPFTFFGICALSSGYNIFRKLRRRRFTATSAVAPGGVKLHASNSRMLLLAVMIGLPAAAIFITGNTPVLIRVFAWIMAGVSAFLIVGVLSGRFAQRFIRFDPLGFTMGLIGFEFLVPWDEVIDIVEFEMHNNPTVGFDVRRQESILVTPESARPRVYKLLGRNKGWGIRHVVIMSSQFATNAESLCAALRNYAGNPAARAELVARPALS